MMGYFRSDWCIYCFFDDVELLWILTDMFIVIYVVHIMFHTLFLVSGLGCDLYVVYFGRT